jgi:hypothetical protein
MYLVQKTFWSSHKLVLVALGKDFFLYEQKIVDDEHAKEMIKTRKPENQ